jgi:ABC-type multidrug transport system ATPase subunit
LSIKIKGGTSNAIVGHSGFGKTTMINMIVRDRINKFNFRIGSMIHSDGEVIIDD